MTNALFAPHLDKETPFLHLLYRSTLSHATFLRMATQIGGVLDEIGLHAGDRFALQVDKSPEAMAIYAACVHKGVIFPPLNTAYTAAELSYFTENGGARLVVCGPARETSIAHITNKIDEQLLSLNADAQAA